MILFKKWYDMQFKLLFCAIIFSLFVSLNVEIAEGKSAEAPIPGNKSTVKLEKEKNLGTFISYETAFFKSLVDLKQNVGKLVNPDDYQQQISKIEKQIEKLGWQVQMAKTDPNMSHGQLSVLDTKLLRQEQNLKKITRPLTKCIQQLSDWEVEWSRKKRELTEWQKVVSPESSFAVVGNNIDELSKTTAGALKIIHKKLRPAIETGQEISKLQVRTYALLVENEELMNENQKMGFQQTMPPIFSAPYFNILNPTLFQTTLEKAKEPFWNIKRDLSDHPLFFLANLFAVILLAAGIKYMGRSIESSEKFHRFIRRPVSVAFFILLLFYLIFQVALIGNLISLEPILQISLSFSVILLAPTFTGYSPGEIRLLRIFALLLIVTWFFKIITLPTPLMQLFIFTASVCMICYCYWRKRVLRRKKKGGIEVIGLRIIILFFIVSCAGSVSGYEQSALYIFSSLVISVVAAHVMALIYFIVNAALELLLHQIPFKLVQANSSAIVNRMAPIVGLISAVLYLFIFLKEWQIYPSREAAANGLLSLEFTVGGIRISPGSVLLTIGIIYIVLMISRSIQKILLDSIFPRYRVELGVQLSMVRLIHYSVMIIGFVILLNILGFELTKLTIIGGALGVGIGFGLQAIVNNFASGLILLFERPIKVGDTIQIGEDFGEVKKLGLRATIVSTFDNAEIVIPNSDLITAPVTNWTLTGRQARVKIPVGVAYGSDIQKVLEILMSCAEENPLVLSQPRPKALFLAFGSSSLDIELRVWTPDFSDRRQLQSELNQEIESEFSLAGIEIPFPQTDLHLRSIDDQASAALGQPGR